MKVRGRDVLNVAWQQPLTFSAPARVFSWMVLLNKASGCGFVGVYGYMPRQANKDAIHDAIERLGIRWDTEFTRSTSPHTFICVCGKRFEAIPYKIFAGHSTSGCGCMRGRRRRRGTEYVPGEYFGCVRQHAKQRGISFDLTLEFMSELLVKQQFRCALSGLEIKLEYSGIKNGTNTASLDRRDNSRGYCKDNVQWVHKDVNWMKQDFDESYFTSLCTAIHRTTNHAD